jgi:UDP-N-acetyl-D-mannosaminuronate dehydrogenase
MNMSGKKVTRKKNASVSFENYEDCLQWLDAVHNASIENKPETENALETFLTQHGESIASDFLQRVLKQLNIPVRQDLFPLIDPNQITANGVSRSETGQIFPIPATRSAYEQERLRLMAKIAIQKALRRKIVVNVGIGYIGTANIAAAANARDGSGNIPYFVIGSQRPSIHSSWKVNVMNQGMSTITTDDHRPGEIIASAIQNGNLTATFLQHQAIAYADLIFVETELHVRKFAKRAIERAEANPEATLKLLATIARLMPTDATVIIESTVYPGFTLKDALPLCNKILQQRGLLNENNNTNLAYSFHRVKPGPAFMHSFFNLQREAGAVNEQATHQLQAYFETTGINYKWQENIIAVELTKDIENAAKYGLLDLMSAFLKSAEVAGVDGFEIIRNIAEARPEEHGRFIDNVAGLQVGGYCVPKELGLLINGLQRHFDVSELQIRDMFFSRITSSSISDFRAEDTANFLIEALGELHTPITESQLYWAGISYKEGVGDTRMAGTERGLRYAAHLGAINRATDPFVVNWPELQKQSLGDPECWGHGLNNQEQLRDIHVHTAEDLTEHLSPFDDAVILAVRHPSYVGTDKQHIDQQTFTASNPRSTHPGTDAIRLSTKMLGLENKIVLDCFDFLSNVDIKKFLALGWQVKAFGKGHIGHIHEQITIAEKIHWREILMAELRKSIELYEQPCVERKNIEEAIAVTNAKLKYLRLIAAQASEDMISVAKYHWYHLKIKQAIRFAQPTAKLFYQSILDKLPINQNLHDCEYGSIQKKHTASLVDQLSSKVISDYSQQLFANIKQAGELLTSIAAHADLVKQPESLAEASRLLQSLRYLKHAGLDSLLQDMDRLVHELMPPSSSLSIAKQIRSLRNRPALAVSEQTASHPLFDPAEAPGVLLRPATVFVSHANGQLEKIEDPKGLPYRYSTKWIPDLANLLQNKTCFPEVWTKFSVEVPINLVRASEGSLAYDLYEDFLHLPLEFRDWLVHDVWENGYVLSTLDGEQQNKIGYLMDINLDPKTIARGRGGILFWQDTRQPILLTTPQGQELPLDIKAIGDYRGGDTSQLKINYDRTIISGRTDSGGTARTNLGQVPGHMYSADDINWQERCKTMGGYASGKSPRSVFRAQWSYPDKANEIFQMVGRASPSTLRLGHVMAGTDDYDTRPEVCAYILGWNNAEVLGHDIVAVHIAMNLDNVMSNGYYTDMGSNIDLYCERDPKGSFRDYAGYGILMMLYTYADMKVFEQGNSKLPKPHTQYIQAWFNGFLDHFFELKHVNRTVDKAALSAFYDIQQRVENNPACAEKIIDEWLDALWQHYLPYHLLRNRISRGYDPMKESPYTTGREDRMYDAYDCQKVLAFLHNQLELIKTAQAIEQSNQYALDFDYARAYQELDQKITEVKQRQNIKDEDYTDVYHLSFYQPLIEDIHTVLDRKMPDRLVIAKAQPSVFIDKMEANVNQRIRLSGLRFFKMMQKINNDFDLFELIAAYAALWKGPVSYEPGDYDIQQQETAESLLKLIRKDIQMASLLEQCEQFNHKDIHWLPIQIETDKVSTGFEYLDNKLLFTLTHDGRLKRTI